MNDSTNKLREIRNDIVQCRQCDLYKTRTHPVVGYGNHNANIMIVGEAPGEQEDLKALPFIGPAGKILDKLLLSIGLKRDDIYITNTVKCRPPENADPTEEQKKECLSYLSRQIDAIKPQVVVCLGNHATKTVLELFGAIDEIKPISKIHGIVIKPDRLFREKCVGLGDVELATTKIMPMYHPAATLHNAALSPSLYSDFKKLKSLLGN